MTRKRQLRPEEVALWQEVARRTAPLSPQRKPALPGPKNPAKLTTVPLNQPLAPFLIGQRSDSVAQGHDVLPGVADRIVSAPLTMDRKAFQRLKRGKLEPEARLDLHGMTAERAHAALNQFIAASAAGGLRCVLVVTGKGGDARGGRGEGVLRRDTPRWLAVAPLCAMVIGVFEAHQRHGGGGALYVYLRRRR